jgi:hypothetical protein
MDLCNEKTPSKKIVMGQHKISDSHDVMCRLRYGDNGVWHLYIFYEYLPRDEREEVPISQALNHKIPACQSIGGLEHKTDENRH